MEDFSKIRFFEAKELGNINCIFGESGSGKSHLASSIKNDRTIVLDGDGVRHYINSDLSFSDEDRMENNIRIAKIAIYLAKQGFDVIISTVRADLAYDYIFHKYHDFVKKDKLHKIKCYIS